MKASVSLWNYTALIEKGKIDVYAHADRPQACAQGVALLRKYL